MWRLERAWVGWRLQGLDLMGEWVVGVDMVVYVAWVVWERFVVWVLGGLKF